MICASKGSRRATSARKWARLTGCRITKVPEAPYQLPSAILGQKDSRGFPGRSGEDLFNFGSVLGLSRRANERLP